MCVCVCVGIAYKERAGQSFSYQVVRGLNLWTIEAHRTTTTTPTKTYVFFFSFHCTSREANCFAEMWKKRKYFRMYYIQKGTNAARVALYTNASVVSASFKDGIFIHAQCIYCGCV